MSDEHTIQLQKDLIEGLIAQARIAAIEECIAALTSKPRCRNDSFANEVRRTLEALKEKPE